MVAAGHSALLLIVGVLWRGKHGQPAHLGGGRRADGRVTGPLDASGGTLSLIGLLMIAGVILLFTGRYGRSLFDLLMGLNRWIYRVIAYVALMRDEYPPFRLDMGPDPADVPAGRLPPPVPA